MKPRMLILLAALPFFATAQTPLEKNIPVKPGQEVRLSFDYPELIRIRTWDKNEVSIRGTVKINGGENDDAFLLEVDTEGSGIQVKGKIRNMEDLPHRITVVRDGTKTTFANEQEWRKWKKENAGPYSMMNRGVDMDITLDITVPAGTETYLLSVYGMVEVKDFSAPLTIKATYGGVDATLAELKTGELIAETNYGHIYSNLTLRPDATESEEEGFHTRLASRPGKGPVYRFDSPYGNVYLRKSP